jgi:hypothetical protein
LIVLRCGLPGPQRDFDPVGERRNIASKSPWGRQTFKSDPYFSTYYQQSDSVQFTLYYRGELKPNAAPHEKHRIRKHFHLQMRALWNAAPLSDFQAFISDPPRLGSLNALVKKHGFTFAPLVSNVLNLVAELDVLMLWPQPAGAIISAGGDIDNRLKTLFDALKVPSEPTALPPGATPDPDETPFFCLLEDDRLITRVNVETDRLLELVTSPADVALFIRVVTRQISKSYGTIAFP